MVVVVKGTVVKEIPFHRKKYRTSERESQLDAQRLSPCFRFAGKPSGSDNQSVPAFILEISFYIASAA